MIVKGTKQLGSFKRGINLYVPTRKTIEGYFWKITNDPSGKTISNFNVTYVNGQIDVDWGAAISGNVPSNTNINHTFSGITRSGISVIPKNGANITKINCGTSSPKLSGTISLSAFPNLQDFRCRFNDVTSINGYQNNSNIIFFDIESNKVTGSLPNFSNFPSLGYLNCSLNLFSGTIPPISSNPLLYYFNAAANSLTGTIPVLSSNTLLQELRLNANQLTGSIPSISNLSALKHLVVDFNYLSGPIPDISNNTKLFELRINNQLGATKISGSIPNLDNLTDLTIFQVNVNSLTGQIPSLNNNTKLQTFWCFNNLLTGSIPSLSALTELRNFRCQGNQLTGAIPDLSFNTKLEVFQAGFNQLSSFDGVSVSNTLGSFDAQFNQLTASAVNAILAAFVAANKTAGTRVLNLGGAGNAAPTGQGITDKATLISRGWTVTTN